MPAVLPCPSVNLAAAPAPVLSIANPPYDVYAAIFTQREIDALVPGKAVYPVWM